MKTEDETTDALFTDMPSDQSQLPQGHLVFDQSQRIIHASSSLRAVLRLGSKLPIAGEAVMDLLRLAVGPRADALRAAEHWLNQSGKPPLSKAGSPLVLLTAVDARTIHGSLHPIGEQYWIAAFEDVTAGLSTESEMLASTYRDTLTGTNNRALFEHKLDEALADVAAGAATGATVLFLDLDRFKVVNDTLGHAVGDALLRVVSERLQSSLRGSDTLARLGGDEFAILLAGSSGKEVASTLAARIIELIQRTYLVNGHVINVGASIGIAVAPLDGDSRDKLLKSADLALYHSKAAGRGVFHFFQPAMEEKAQRRRTLELDLRKALVLRQFELHYQPQIDVDNQRITGLEGLLRWRHPKRGLLLPEEFLSVAEEIGLAVSMGGWVLKTACGEAARWPDSITVAVNISPLQFEMSDFAAFVERCLGEARLAGPRLEIEVTEDILLRDGGNVRRTLEALRALGVRVAMDSFGTGLASLSHLVNFPFDTIKLDPSLIDMHRDGVKHRAIVRAICALGQSLGIATLAEGVETREQLADVRSEGCDSVQGFYYSKAVPASELTNLFSNAFPVAADHRLAGKGAA